MYARSCKIQGKLSQRHKFIVFWMTTLKDAFSPNEAARLKSQSVSTRPCTPSLIWSIQLYMEECYHLLGRGFPMESLFLKDFDCFYIFYEIVLCLLLVEEIVSLLEGLASITWSCDIGFLVSLNFLVAKIVLSLLWLLPPSGTSWNLHPVASLEICLFLGYSFSLLLLILQLQIIAWVINLASSLGGPPSL